MSIHRSITDLIGGTPLLELVRYENKYALQVRLVAKLERFNPTGSVKDRIAKSMLEDAEKKGCLPKTV